MNLLLIIISTGFKLGIKGIKQELRYREIKEQQVKTELDLLKAQIHPHFLFNTLNNLFSMARKNKDDPTAEGIAKLSHLLRYMIYDSKVEKIILKKEVEQINSFIELQKFRFEKDDDIKIDFNIDGDIEKAKIAPMLLIPFVENAFKHSISLQNPTIIEINLLIKNNDLHFSVKNSIYSKKQKQENAESGIGLINIKRRLELLYPDLHELKIKEDENFFQIDLKLNFKK
jgi:LytS/YehU family sensor histidine kinase